MQNYDSDQKFPVFGFGGKLPGESKASHCFALNGDIFNPEVIGVQGILNAYHKSINVCGLFGPTYFTPVLQQINGHMQVKSADQSQYSQKYQILMIITDGDIQDLQTSIDEIVAASSQPLSIIIIGVGNGEFTIMDNLDADTKPLFSDKFKIYQTRDIV